MNWRIKDKSKPVDAGAHWRAAAGRAGERMTHIGEHRQRIALPPSKQCQQRQLKKKQLSAQQHRSKCHPYYIKLRNGTSLARTNFILQRLLIKLTELH